MDNLISAKIEEAVHYKENEFPKKHSKDVEFVDIKSLKELKKTISDIMGADDWDGITSEADIELASHIKMEGKTTKEVIDWLDELPVRDLENLINDLRAVAPSCEISIKEYCVHCQTEQNFELDVSKDIFESLLK
jgi:hypothetical protein